MGVMIEPIAETPRIRVSGDVETVLTVAYESDERFLLGLSDGTLLVGAYDHDLRCRFDVARDGAGFVRFHQDKAEIQFDIEWATVSPYDPNVVERRAPGELPLFANNKAIPSAAAIDDEIPW